jgi:CRISPR system Cascade subunit CasA
MPDKEFNLIHEPWMLVLKPDCTVEEVSLLELFRSAHKCRRLAGEMPTQDVAVLRLLLAILYAVFSRYDPDGNFAPLSSSEDALKRWKVIWDKGEFPMEIIEDYLLHFEDRFWLFHPQHPFYQVMFREPVINSRAQQIKPTERKVAFLIGDIAESDDKARLFSGRMQKDSISYNEAARWLLHLNSFDVAPGGRPSSHGITIKGYGISWLGMLGIIWASGANFFETLMLNLVLATGNKVWGGDGAVWEQDRICDASDLESTLPKFPQNPWGLLTMQFRRVQLLRDEQEKRVTKLLLWSGQQLNTKNALLEYMTLWSKNEKGDYVPRRHDPSRQMWQDFSAILASAAADPDLTPGIIKWISLLKRDNILQLPFVHLNTVGVMYKNNTALTHVFADSLRINLSLLDSLGAGWVSRITDELETTDRLVIKLAELVQNLAKAAGKVGNIDDKMHDKMLKEAVRAAKEQAYFRLDEPFRRWLEKIDHEKDEMNIVCDLWWKQAQGIIRDYGKELVEQVGIKAYVGRTVMENGTMKRYVAPEAFNRFQNKISHKDMLKGGKRE